MGFYDLLQLKIILADLGVKWARTMKLCCDNKSTINIANNLVQHARTKHMEVNKHFIKEKLDNSLFYTPYVSTTGQLVDILTKGLPTHSFQHITSKLAMDNIYSPA